MFDFLLFLQTDDITVNKPIFQYPAEYFWCYFSYTYNSLYSKEMGSVRPFKKNHIPDEFHTRN